MKRFSAVLLSLVLLLVVLGGSIGAVETKTMTVSLRIEGVSENIYNNDALLVSYTGDTLSAGEVIRSRSGSTGFPTVIWTSDGADVYSIGTLVSGTYGGTDEWLCSISGNPTDSPNDSVLSSGDEIVLYYGNASDVQIPEVDLAKMMSDGIVRFFSRNTPADGAENPIAGATVIWDGMEYLTDAGGEIIIDSTGAGTAHTLSIERYDADGLPTVLRFAPGFSVVYGFADVMPGIWYYDAVMFAVNSNLFDGMPDGNYYPETSMNRAMFVTVLGRMAGASVDQNASTSFSDVVNDGWSSGYILWASENGIVTGNTDGTFDQYAGITREQIASILYRFAEGTGSDVSASASLSEFPDADQVSSYALEAMKWAVGAGIIGGTDSAMLLPANTATRAQVATMLQRFVGLES